MSNKIVPLISSGTAGPLGLLHLPRLWQKVSLDAKGLLADGYPAVGPGFDQMLLDAIGIEKDEFVAFIKSNTPTYPQTEAWILEKKGGNIDQATKDKFNAAATGYEFDDDTVTGILNEVGLSSEKCSFKDAVNLNNLDDWNGFHASVLK